MRALITGAAGFVAGYLARELTSAGWHVEGSTLEPPAGTSRDWFSGKTPRNEMEPSFRRLIEADAANPEAMRRALDESTPDVVFHLAGISSVGAAERDPVAAFRVNCIGLVVTLLEVETFQSRTGRQVTVLVVGSAEQYGRHPALAMPLPETAQTVPVTVYAASKCAQETAALQATRARGLRVVCARSFNHSGAGQRTDFLLPALVRRALDLKRDGGRSLPVGNTAPVRDYLHVEDVVRAYRLLVERGAAGEIYNVSSGTGLSVEQIAMAVLRRIGIDAALEIRPDLVRPVDIPVLIGNSSKLSRDTGWQPTKSFDDILEDLILAASQ